MSYKGLKYLVVGCGFWGAVFARKIAEVLDEKVLIIDKRFHIGGNSYSEDYADTGIDCHKYGSHIFHTSSKEVWNYVNRFSEFNNYRHKILTTYKNQIYQMPVNLATINSYYNLNLTPFEAEKFLRDEIEKYKIVNPANLEEKAISLIGKPLYEAFIKGYTQKQWNKEPKYLPSEIVTRLPVRTSYNANYFSDLYEGVPLGGYGKLFENILSHDNIEIKLNTNYFDIKNEIPSSCKIIYTGVVDEFFDYKYGNLDWRSLSFEWQIHNVSDYQGVSIMNYGDAEVPYTRIHEFKHYHPEKIDAFNSDKTVICIEYPQDYSLDKEAFYPINDAQNNKIYDLYEQEALKNPNLIVGGRLGAYKYWDMDKTVENALGRFDLMLERGF